MFEHGEYKVTVDRELIHVTFMGMFNEVASQNLCDAVEALINAMEGKKFCLLFNMLEYQGSTPSAHKVGDKHFEWLETQNCVGKAIVISNMALVEISRNEQTSLRESTIKTNIFETEVEAKTWLSSL